jgi:hypothetical protein
MLEATSLPATLRRAGNSRAPLVYTVSGFPRLFYLARLPGRCRIQKDDFYRGDKNLLRWFLFTLEPPADVKFGDPETLGELLHPAENQTGAMQCARMNASVLGRRQWAVLSGTSCLSHQRNRAVFLAHTQVAIVEIVLSCPCYRASNNGAERDDTSIPPLLPESSSR